jgi:hypothetical protein
MNIRNNGPPRSLKEVLKFLSLSKEVGPRTDGDSGGVSDPKS